MGHLKAGVFNRLNPKLQNDEKVTGFFRHYFHFINFFLFVESFSTTHVLGHNLDRIPIDLTFKIFYF